VRVEVLDGARGGADLRVARIADELFGYTAYLDIAALNRLAGQGPTVDTIALRQSAGERASLYARLRDTPRAGTLVEPAELAAGFRATAGRNVLVFTTIVAGFAAAVAFGVVYNNLRVALAERAWELASLRVLGFSRAEVSTMLIGEMAIVLTAAVPVGLLLGRALASALCALLHGETFRIPVVIEPRTYLLGAAVTIVAGIASALLVRRRIDSLDLVAVLKVRE
jgi:putative ABC transport system permease protein